MKPGAIIAELRRIANKHGGVLQPETVVQAARTESSPLHGAFCWDDTEAARLYRIVQARQLIRVSVEVIQPADGGKEFSVRAFVSLTPDRDQDGGGYRFVSEVLRNTAARGQMLADALAELRVFEEKYRVLSELAAVFSAARKVRAKR